MRQSMYGSTDQYALFTRTCPSAGAGIGASTSAKSDSLGKPTGRAASWNCRFTDGKGPNRAADIGLYYLSGKPRSSLSSRGPGVSRFRHRPLRARRYPGSVRIIIQSSLLVTTGPSGAITSAISLIDWRLAAPLEGPMSFREQLRAYIAQLEQRLRWSTLFR